MTRTMMLGLLAGAGLLVVAVTLVINVSGGEGTAEAERAKKFEADLKAERDSFLGIKKAP
jgi:hypothetical protein